MQIPRPGKLGAGNFMAVRLVELDRPDCRSCFDRVRLCPTTPGGSINGRRFQWLCTNRPSDRRGDGCLYRATCNVEQPEHVGARENDQNIRHLPHCRLVQLLRRTIGNVRLQT